MLAVSGAASLAGTAMGVRLEAVRIHEQKRWSQYLQAGFFGWISGPEEDTTQPESVPTNESGFSSPD